MVVSYPQTWTDVMHAFYKKGKELTQSILYSTIPALAVPNRNPLPFVDHNGKSMKYRKLQEQLKASLQL